MTTEKREPFAKVVVADDGDSWIVLVDGNTIAGNPHRDLSWETRVEIINSAFNARVDAEAKKAVEEFRERAALQCEKRAESLTVGTAVANQCARDVRSLPTEPERNGK